MRYFLLLLMLLTTQAQAADQEQILIGGTQVSELNSYSYIGMLNPFAGAKIGDGWYSKIIASWLTYNYDTFANNANVTVKAKSPGVDLGVGYSWSGKNYGLSLGLSGGYRHINISPYLPNEKPQGDVFTITPDIEALYRLNEKFDTDLISSYAFGQQAFFSRARFGWHPIKDWRVGVEAFFQKGQNYRSRQFGIFGASYLINGLSYELSGGVSENDNGSTSPYIGVGFAKFF